MSACVSLLAVRMCLTLARSVPQPARNALAHPQLLVPVAIAAGGSAWNAADAGPDVQFIYVLLGFMSYKVAVLDQAYKALKKVTIWAEVPVERPVLKDLPDIDQPY